MKQSVLNQIVLVTMALFLLITMATVQASQDPDVLTELIGQPFRTYDRNDDDGCASRFGGAWWFGSDCARLNLNGDFEASGTPGVWYGVPLDANKIKKFEMKIRPME